MNLYLFGINHKTSDVSERERFIIDESAQIFLENYLKEKFPNAIESFFGISTCNRTEFFFTAMNDITDKVFYAIKHALDIDLIPDSDPDSGTRSGTRFRSRSGIKSGTTSHKLW